MKHTLFAVLLATLFSVSCASELPGYDFNYTVTGDEAAAPIQAFDDGTHLYLQFRDSDTVPALFVNTAEGAVRLAVHEQFPYLVTDTLSPEILIKSGAQQAIVRYEGGRAFADGGVMTGSARPQAVASSARVPSEDARPAPVPMSSAGSAPGEGNFTGELIFRQPGTDGFRELSRPDSSVPAAPVSFVAPASAANVGAHLHIVDAGESISSIAHQHKTSIRQIAVLNHLRNVNLIYIGQKLILPDTTANGASITGHIDKHRLDRSFYREHTSSGLKKVTLHYNAAPPHHRASDFPDYKNAADSGAVTAPIKDKQ